MHLIIDGYTSDPERIKSKELIYQFLDEYPAQIGMTKIAPPLVYEYEGGNPRDWGVSAFVLIAESHISIHTFPERAYINIDIFSYKEFDASRATRDLQRRFALKEVRSHLMERPFVE